MGHSPSLRQHFPRRPQRQREQGQAARCPTGLLLSQAASPSFCHLLLFLGRETSLRLGSKRGASVLRNGRDRRRHLTPGSQSVSQSVCLSQPGRASPKAAVAAKGRPACPPPPRPPSRPGAELPCRLLARPGGDLPPPADLPVPLGRGHGHTDRPTHTPTATATAPPPPPAVSRQAAPGTGHRGTRG